MKTLLPLLIALFLLAPSCKKERGEVNLPESVKLGKSEVYLNGSEADYKPRFFFHKAYNHINFPFQQIEGDIVNQVSFAWLPIKTGDFELHDEPIQYIKAFTHFSQIVDEDLPGYQYELENAEEGFFKIEGLDTLKREVKGRFRAQFRRTKTNGYDDLGLPEKLLYQGVFNEKYEVK